jgi:hypothetical protein
MRCPFLTAGATADEKLLNLGEHNVAVHQDLMIRESQHRISGQLQQYVAFAVGGETGLLTMFGTVYLDNTTLVTPEQIEADRVGERMGPVGLIPLATGRPLRGMQRCLEQLLGFASGMGLPGNRRIGRDGAVGGPIDWFRIHGRWKVVRRLSEPDAFDAVDRRQTGADEPNAKMS